jgi:hypothetical protein
VFVPIMSRGTIAFSGRWHISRLTNWIFTTQIDAVGLAEANMSQQVEHAYVYLAAMR